jgi:LuxR family transcriptional regulator, maltose regulon positive regulatory protein
VPFTPPQAGPAALQARPATTTQAPRQLGLALDRLSRQDREHGDARIAAAALRLVQGDPRAALTELAPVLDGPAAVGSGFRLVTAHALQAAARDALGDRAAAQIALERAVDLAEPTGVLQPFLLAPVLGLLEYLTRHRTAHASLTAEIRGLLAGTRTGPQHGAPPPSRPGPLLEPLSGSELRVLRYLPTNLSAPEIARQLSVSPNTVKTHIRHLYAKLGTRSRADAVESARALGLLAPVGLRARPVSPRNGTPWREERHGSETGEARA